MQQWRRPGVACWPVAEAAPDAADAAETGGSEGAGVDKGVVLQASDDKEEVAHAAT